MKKLIVFGLMLTGTHIYAQGSHHAKAPEVVRMAFSKVFPGVNDVRWEMEKGLYEADFRQDGQKTSATFDKDGKWLETERAIDIKALPSEATMYIEKNFNGRIARKASIIKNASGETTYEAHLNGKDYIFDAGGKFVKIEKD